MRSVMVETLGLRSVELVHHLGRITLFFAEVLRALLLPRCSPSCSGPAINRSTS